MPQKAFERPESLRERETEIRSQVESLRKDRWAKFWLGKEKHKAGYAAASVARAVMQVAIWPENAQKVKHFLVTEVAA